MTLTRRRLAAAASLLAVPAAARAADPAFNHPLRLILAFGTGTGADVIARELGRQLGTEVGQPVVVENLTGGTGIVAMRTVGRAAPDGHTLFLGALGNVVINPMTNRAAADTPPLVAPVGLVCQNAHVFLVSGKLPVRDVREFIAYAKANPGQVNFASPGTGGVSHLGAELFQSIAGIEGVHVPYRDGSTLMTDLMTGRTQAVFMSAGGLMPIIASGAVRALGLTAPTQVPELRDLPVLETQGLPGFRYATWYGLYTTAGTPAPMIGRLNAALRAALGNEEVKARLIGQGADVATGSPEELAALMEHDRRMWQDIITSRRITLE
ncbi:tripartite tricarboxylate transporter substrate binding protein [Roseomonas sp. NAR14]|uniref:Tripartite tricarboxylate transporter substrate binding protein n=1 Tax=Roseomonas acroporae TaxID=2937791 RepID=A0A9X1Y7H5_9PROT|nr:tripartite tricarboxylate transporter substrate binding protein [Roseomonas acroporae]MCK8784555.1 tripartite tricarboxylate transporter substrate binding protein [Roseomonas acroporae]